MAVVAVHGGRACVCVCVDEAARRSGPLHILGYVLKELDHAPWYGICCLCLCGGGSGSQMRGTHVRPRAAPLPGIWHPLALRLMEAPRLDDDYARLTIHCLILLLILVHHHHHHNLPCRRTRTQDMTT